MIDLSKIIIGRPGRDDFDSISELLTCTINHTFIEEQISGDNRAEIEREIESHLQALHRYLESDGRNERFLIARDDSEIVGIIAFGEPNRIILANLDFDSADTPEVKCAYVHPEYQQKGVGSRLFKEIIQELNRRGTRRFCLDSGYKRAQLFWTKHLGPPTVTLPDYFGPDAPHMIWLCEVSHLV